MIYVLDASAGIEIALNKRYQTPGQALAPGRIASLSDPRVGVLIPFFPCAYSGIELTSRFCSSRSLGNKEKAELFERELLKASRIQPVPQH